MIIKTTLFKIILIIWNIIITLILFVLVSNSFSYIFVGEKVITNKFLDIKKTEIIKYLDRLNNRERNLNVLYENVLKINIQRELGKDLLKIMIEKAISIYHKIEIIEESMNKYYNNVNNWLFTLVDFNETKLHKDFKEANRVSREISEAYFILSKKYQRLLVENINQEEQIEIMEGNIVNMNGFNEFDAFYETIFTNNDNND